jgi:hypothetical protein
MTLVRKGLDNRRFDFSLAPQGGTIHHLPQTARGLAESCNRKGVKILCPSCKVVRKISECIRILAERESSVTYLVRLDECSHLREFSQAISRTPSNLKKLSEEKSRAAKARKKLESDEGTGEPACALDPDEEETQAIHDSMRAEGTLIESGEDTDSGDPKELQ